MCSKPSQGLVNQIIDGEVEEEGPKGSLFTLRTAVYPWKPFYPISGLSPSPETLGWSRERSRGRRETSLPSSARAET